MADLLCLVHDPLRKRLTVHDSIDAVTVRIRHAGNVIRGLCAALNFEARNAAFDELRNVLDHAHIAGIEDIRRFLILFDREHLIRTRALDEVIIPAARLRAIAVVCVSAGHIV